MPKHNRGGPGQLRAHSRSSSATRLGANLQFTQPGAAPANQAPQKLVRRASGYGEQTNTTRVAPPLARVNSGQRVQSREQLAKRLTPLHTQRPPSRQSKTDAAAKKAYEAQRQAVQDAGDEDDDDEWESSVESATPDQEGSGSETASEDEMDQAILKNLNLGQQQPQQQGPTRATQQDFDEQLLQQQHLREYERQQRARIEQEQREQYLLQQQYQHEQLQRQQLAQQEHQRLLQLQHRQQQQQLGGGGQRQYEEQLALQQQYEQRQYLAQQEHQRMLQQQQMQMQQQQQRGGGGQMRFEDQQALQQQYEQRKYLEQQHLQRLQQQQLQQQQHYQQQQQQQQKVRQPQPIRQTDFVVPEAADRVERTNSIQRVNSELAPGREVASTPRPTTPRQSSGQNMHRVEQQQSSQSQHLSNRRSRQYLEAHPEDQHTEEHQVQNTSTPPTPQNNAQSDKVPSTSPTTDAKPTTNSQRSPRPGHLKSRPPSMHSITSSRTDHIRPHPLFRGLSHGPPRTTPLAPLTVVPTSANTEIPLSGSPEGSVSSARQFLSSSPTSQRTASGGSPASVAVSVADLTHPFASQSTNGNNGYSKNGGRRTSVSGASMRSAATTATSSVLHLPPHFVSVHAGILAGPNERARTMSAMNGSSNGGGGTGGSSAALSSLTNLPTTTRPPSPQAIAFFPPTNPHANLDSIHPLLPPPYLVNHLTILSRRTPLRESFDRVIRAKNAAR